MVSLGALSPAPVSTASISYFTIFIIAVCHRGIESIQRMASAIWSLSLEIVHHSFQLLIWTKRIGHHVWISRLLCICCKCYTLLDLWKSMVSWNAFPRRLWPTKCSHTHNNRQAFIGDRPREHWWWWPGVHSWTLGRICECVGNAAMLQCTALRKKSLFLSLLHHHSDGYLCDCKRRGKNDYLWFIDMWNLSCSTAPNINSEKCAEEAEESAAIRTVSSLKVRRKKNTIAGRWSTTTKRDSAGQIQCTAAANEWK